MKKLHCILALAAVLLALPGLAAAEDAPRNWLDGSDQAALISMLSGYEYEPSLETLATLDGDVHVMLTETALDTELTQMARSRAIVSLEFYPSELTKQTFVLLVTTPAEALGDPNRVLAARSIQTATRTYISSDPQWVVDLATPMIADESAYLREVVVTQLGELRTIESVAPSVDESLLQLVIAERNPSVKEALKGALSTNKTLTLENTTIEPVVR